MKNTNVMTKYCIVMVIIITLFITTIKSNEEFENSTHICNKCDCNNGTTLFYLNCTERSITNTLANWPNGNENKTVKLVASFSYNNIKRLKRMPSTKLQLEITYNNCGIEELDSDLFESCPNVTFLDLSYNNIERDDLSPDIFKGPYKNDDQTSPIALEQLSLAYNKIHSLSNDLFEHTPHLKILNLAGNNFKVIDLHTSLAISTIKQLEEINLSDNSLTELPAACLKTHRQLKILNLSNNALDTVPISLNFIAPYIKKLYMDNNPVINLDASFMGMEELEELTLNNLTKLKRIRTNTFNALVMLKRMEMKNNRLLTEIEDEAFGSILNLKELHLTNNSLRTLPKNMIKWQQLEVFDIRDNDFVCTCDLYEISGNLSNITKLDHDGPYCYNLWSSRTTPIYYLNKDTCLDAVITDLRFTNNRNYGSYKIMKMSIVMLTIVFVLFFTFALWLGYAKWMKVKRNKNYPFTSRIIYNPLNASQ